MPRARSATKMIAADAQPPRTALRSWRALPSPKAAAKASHRGAAAIASTTGPLGVIFSDRSRRWSTWYSLARSDGCRQELGCRARAAARRQYSIPSHTPELTVITTRPFRRGGERAPPPPPPRRPRPYALRQYQVGGKSGPKSKVRNGLSTTNADEAGGYSAMK